MWKLVITWNFLESITDKRLSHCTSRCLIAILLFLTILFWYLNKYCTLYFIDAQTKNKAVIADKQRVWLFANLRIA